MKRILYMLSASWVILLIGCTTPQMDEEFYPFDQMQAVSLRILQEKLSLCMGTGSCPDELLNLVSLTKIHGYVIDEANQDVILFGDINSEAPPLRTEDFVVALRNAWLKYSTRQGNTVYIVNPGCSIDPNSQVMGRLDEIGRKIQAQTSYYEIEKALKSWHDTCENPQNVRVLGIPFNTHFAKAMVGADYYMKNLVNGSEQLEVNGFESLTDMTLKRLKDDFIHNRPISVRLASMNRFEFYPGENEYLEDVGTILIEKCPVVLITEEEYLSRNGNIIGTGRPDPLAQEFAESFSRHYDDIAKQKPIYLELEGLFRFVALAKTLKYKDVSIELDYFLQQFPISEVPVPSTLAGIPHIEDFEHRQDYQGGYQIAKLWLPSCGGVGIEINVREGNFKSRPDKRLYDLRHTLFESRPSIATLSWPFGRKKRPAIPEDVIMVQGALQQGQSLGWIRNNLPENTSVYAIDQLSKQEIFVLSKEDNEFELFAVYSKHVNSFATGIEAVFQFNEIAREACKRATNKDIKFVHASQEGDDAILQIGKEQIRLASSEITALLNDPISRKPLPIDDVLVLK